MIRVDNVKFFIFGLLFLFNVLPILAPILECMGEKNFSSFIYWVYSFSCHQKASRSFFICDNQCGLCARCTFMWFSMLVSSGLSFYFIPSRARDRYFNGISLLTAFLMSLPLILDSGIQFVSTFLFIAYDVPIFYESTNTLRALTGGLFGIGVGMFLFPKLNKVLSEGL